MVDIHCHILPQVDDGAASWEVATAMCAMAAADGITHIVATPHCNHQYFYDRAEMEKSLDKLRELAASEPARAALSFSLGCDFHQRSLQLVQSRSGLRTQWKDWRVFEE